MTLEFIASDGTPLLADVIGDGPPLLLVHGSLADRRCFDPVLPFLEGYRCVVYDRRGHGASGDASRYSIRREADDLLELAALLGSEVRVLAWSYGATVALLAMDREPTAFAAAVLYEPPASERNLFTNLAELLSMVTAGCLDDAVRAFVQQTFHLSDSALAAMRRHEAWTTALRLVPTLPREIAAINAVDPTTCRSSVPTRVLVTRHGGNPAFRRIAAVLVSEMSDSELAMVPGLPHFAMATAPQALAASARQWFGTGAAAN